MLRDDVKSVARICETFHLDPVALMQDPPFHMALRVAAHNALQADQVRRNAAAKGS